MVYLNSMALGALLLSPFASAALTKCPTKEATWTAQSGAGYSICKNTDYRNGGASLKVTKDVRNTNACAQICNQDPRCVKAVYDKKGRICHIKDENNADRMNWEKDNNFDAITLTNVDEGRFISTCPTGGHQYRALKGKGKTFNVCYSTDFVGASARQIKNVASLAACADQCSKINTCKKAVYDNEGKVCHIKAAEPNASLFWVQSKRFSVVQLPSAVKPATQGRWSDIIRLPVIPVAAYVVPQFPQSQQLLFFSSWGADAFGGASGRTQFGALDLPTGVVAQREVADTHHDMFCPGMSQLGDGRIIIQGGSDAEAVTFYNPKDNSFTRGPDMKMPRGYQTSTILSDGRVFTIGGAYSGPRQGKNGEVYDPKTNKWTMLTGADVKPMLTTDHEGIWREDNHAWLFGWKKGSVFQAGPSTTQHWYSTKQKGSVRLSGKRDDVNAMCGVFAMYDALNGKILTAGGAADYTNSNANKHAHITTIGEAYKPASVKRIADMAFPRGFGNAAVLPDGTVLVTGGQRRAMVFTNTDGILVPELYNPATNKWTQLAPHAVPRNYHSVSILLPDATVFIGGGGLCYVNKIGGSSAGCDKTADHADGEIFQPPYLFNKDGSLAARPLISGLVQKGVKAGSTLKFKVTNSSGKVTMSLVRMGSVTHSVNSDQRRVPLTNFSVKGNDYSVKLPSDNGILLPGYYYLFVMNAQGVPSMSKTVQIVL
ncbi:Galactose oxidase [Fusarium venenatum]|uniref:Apple domain-containing protein n=1 Tax=Fusarium venenatum TaxID=56646 RepID=A0A2L2T472_9HYPO|nr:uncharacterized protein FVRRES_13734 [Fusarium venenatum]KAG8358738.1 Galactose oxidase [Fusarium venenatum]KAH6980244.1 hypothetical protein EDB82DRAFT_510428 [Fusarium venenatum]CEI41770.1 unnamed protein product [Fusarium venenatum]